MHKRIYCNKQNYLHSLNICKYFLLTRNKQAAQIQFRFNRLFFQQNTFWWTFLHKFIQNIYIFQTLWQNNYIVLWHILFQSQRNLTQRWAPLIHLLDHFKSTEVRGWNQQQQIISFKTIANLILWSLILVKSNQRPYL